MATTPFSKLAYQTLQQGKGLAGLVHKDLSTRLMSLVAPDAVPSTESVPPEMLNTLRAAMAKLEERDWADAEQGVYPEELLFDAPWLEWARTYPMVWLDLPSTWSRRKQRNVKDLPEGTDPSLYPDYYLQNFHHQTDGYLSDHSAGLYDLSLIHI